MCDDAYRRIHSEAANLLVPGTRFEDNVRQVVIAKSKPDKRDRDKAWLQERSRQHREVTRAPERSLSDRSWILAPNRPMSSGGTSGLRVDITAVKQVQAARCRSGERLHRTWSRAGIGSREQDIATGRYVSSRELYRIRGLSPEAVEPDFDNVGPYAHGKPYRIHDLTQLAREALGSRRKRRAGDGREQAAGADNETRGCNELMNGETV